jgi:hypothetical protein
MEAIRTAQTIRVSAEVAQIGRFSVRVSWLAPYLAVSKPNWTDEEEAAATELGCYHAETLADARKRADRPEWVLRLALCEFRDGGVAFRYEIA